MGSYHTYIGKLIICISYQDYTIKIFVMYNNTSMHVYMQTYKYHKENLIVLNLLTRNEVNKWFEIP